MFNVFKMANFQYVTLRENFVILPFACSLFPSMTFLVAAWRVNTVSTSHLLNMAYSRAEGMRLISCGALMRHA